MSRSGGIGGVVVVAMTLVAMGCGGSGGGGGGGGGGGSSTTAGVSGNGLAPASGPGDTQSYFPAAQGDTWSFNYVTNDTTALGTSAIVSVTASGTKTVNGVAGTVFTRADPTLSSGGYDQYFTVSAGGVSLLGDNDASDPITPLLQPYPELLFPVQVGPVYSTVTGTNLPFGKDANGQAIMLDVTQTIANAALETVDVPAGTFTNVVRQTTSVSATAHDNGQTTPPITANQTTWIAPGVGEIKEQISSSNNGISVSSAAELRGYVLNNQHHGLGETVDLGASLNNSCNLGSYGVAAPHIASDGSHFVVLAKQCDASTGTATLKWVALFLQPDGSVQNSVDLIASTALDHASIGFDGTNYLVVYEDNPTNASNDWNLEAVLLSPAGTIVSGPNVVGESYADSTVLSGDAEALAFDGNRYLLIYTDASVSGQPPQLSGRFVSRTSGQPDGAPFPISSTNSYSHLQPALGFDGTHYLAVWNETGSNPPGLLAARISTAGALLDAAPLLIMDNSVAAMSSGSDFDNLQPSVSFDGTNYLIAYRDVRKAAPYSGEAKISGARVSPSGVLLDGSATVPGITVTTASGVVIGSLKSTFLNGNHWIVWSFGVLIAAALNASRVSVSGQVPSVWPNGFSLVTPAGTAVEQQAAVMAASGGGLFTWIQLPAPLTTTSVTLRAMPIYPAGP